MLTNFVVQIYGLGTRDKKNALEQLEISGGNKGIVTFDAKVKSADVDIHSSYGGIVESAPWYLIQALTSLRAADGRILVDGLYDDVQEPNERELALVETYAQTHPEENQPDLWFGITTFTGGTYRLSKNVFSLSQLSISKESSQDIKGKELKRFCQQRLVPS